MRESLLRSGFETHDSRLRSTKNNGQTSTPAPSVIDGLRAFAVMLGGSIALNVAAAASVASVTRALIRRRLPAPLAAAGVAATIMYLEAIRPRMLNWGASADDACRQLPGDVLTPGDPIESTNAVTIDAPAKEVWPWLAQLGQDRGGFYSYEWLENLAGCRMQNADRIHPEWQRPRELGETVKLHWAFGLPVSIYEPGRALGLKGWGTFVVEPLNAKRTRLLARSHRKHGVGGLYNALLMQIPHFLMQRRMLLGIKERAERASSESGIRPKGGDMNGSDS
jgi:hypothetical protein